MTLEAAVEVWGKSVEVRFWRRMSLEVVDLEDSWREIVESTDWRPGRWEEREVVERAWRAEVMALVDSLVVLLVLLLLLGGMGVTDRERFLLEDLEEEAAAVAASVAVTVTVEEA